MTSVFHVFLLLAVASVSLAADTTRLTQEDDIRETVFRYQFDHNASGLQKSAKGYFLAIGEKGVDPSAEFMKRFAHHNPPVHKGSAWRTGNKGLFFRVTSIAWISDTEVEVVGGYYEGNVSSSGNTYTVKKDTGKWQVTNDKMGTISHGPDIPCVDC
jgi:hypothetical protein